MLSRIIVHSRQKSYFSSHLSFCTLWYNTNFCSKINFQGLKILYSVHFIVSSKKTNFETNLNFSFLLNILVSIHQVFLINFQFQGNVILDLNVVSDPQIPVTRVIIFCGSTRLRKVIKELLMNDVRLRHQLLNLLVKHC